ncbi:MAG: hypothetical protein IJK40_09475 [Clostridia bacterium]|nr:hypothetical protein [Clostridia bacterium]MBR0538371.1 hypothetical protein [Clostridia bacterium]
MLYAILSHRRSVRSYTDEKPDAALREEILQYLNGTTGIPGQTARFRIITAQEMGNDMAPYYVVASCEKADAAYANVGFVMEKLDLWLQDKGLGSLWYGMKLPKVSEADDCIVMAFGFTEVPQRTEESSFKRLPLEKISDTDNAVARAVRLAPSAVNSQPWTLKFEENSLTLTLTGRGLLRLKLEKKLNKIDLGIALRFAVTALEHEGKRIAEIRPNTDGKAFSITVKYE